MRRMPIPRRNRFLWPRGHAAPRRYAVLVGISPGYPPAGGRSHTCYSPVRRSPAGEASFAPAAPRLACVKPVASVHPEPGSNSSLLLILFFFFFKFKQGKKLLSFAFARQPTSEPYPYGSRPVVLCFYWAEIDLRLFHSCTDTSCEAAPKLFALVLLLVYCNRFNVLCRSQWHCLPESECKVTTLFARLQIFSAF